MFCVVADGGLVPISCLRLCGRYPQTRGMDRRLSQARMLVVYHLGFVAHLILIQWLLLKPDQIGIWGFWRSGLCFGLFPVPSFSDQFLWCVGR